MSRKFLHEEIYRGAESLSKLAAPRLTICGAGALGSHLADSLARQGVKNIRAIDRDRVEEHNVSTQLYGISEVGAWKVEALRNRLFRAVEVEIDAVSKELTERNVKALLKGTDLAIDTFDNAQARRLVQEHCREAGIGCLHVGLYADYCEAIWDANYRVPRDVAGDVCEYPLARNLVLLAVALASELVLRFVINGEKRDYSGTLVDFAFREIEARQRAVD
jgi:molybdopterin/thiamine biosynthesis adenylyltransferase